MATMQPSSSALVQFVQLTDQFVKPSTSKNLCPCGTQTGRCYVHPVEVDNVLQQMQWLKLQGYRPLSEPEQRENYDGPMFIASEMMSYGRRNVQARTVSQICAISFVTGEQAQFVFRFPVKYNPSNHPHFHSRL